MMGASAGERSSTTVYVPQRHLAVKASVAASNPHKAPEGLQYDLANGVRGNTLLAHELLHLAAEHRLSGEMKEALLHAYFEEGRSVFSVDDLVPLAVEVGLDEVEVRAALTDRRYVPAVRQDAVTAEAL